MAEPPIPHSSPYCCDPNCESCKQLRETQEAIRQHLPLPSEKELDQRLERRRLDRLRRAQYQRRAGNGQ
jgi:hypothetical protein